MATHRTVPHSNPRSKSQIIIQRLRRLRAVYGSKSNLIPLPVPGQFPRPVRSITLAKVVEICRRRGFDLLVQ
jgi:hypothetical protein